MTTLVTGAAGLLGEALVRHLLAGGGDPLRVLVRSREQAEHLVALAPGRVEAVVGTLLRVEDCARAVDGARTIFHLAARMRGAAADLFLHTVVGSERLLAAVAAARERPRVLLVSSLAVYAAAEIPAGAWIDEDAPVEPNPERRDLYSFAKLRQEQRCRELCLRHGLDLTVVRPGVLYGPRTRAIPARVGLELPGVFLHLGGGAPLPLCYVDNCAAALAFLATAAAGTYNALDDDPPTCARFLALYRRHVRPLRAVPVPRVVARLLARANERYTAWSEGQLPAVLTPYKLRALWGGHRYASERLRRAGYRQPVATAEALRRAFDHPA